jgi:hypothetical protein
MKIEQRFDRVLIKDDLCEVNINDGLFVKYTGIYYKHERDTELQMEVNIEEIETIFIGIIETQRSYMDCITGIYIKPLYIHYNNEWKLINNYKEPKFKYFLYPHLLMLTNTYYHYHPLYFLNSIEPFSTFDIFENIALFEL